MVGSITGSDGRSKEAMGMMALHEALRSVCLSSDWTYSVFWTIRPRPRCRGGNGCKVGDGNGCKVGDENGSLMLMWEDGFCRTRVAECLEDVEGEDLVRKAFSKMSIQLYNYGEGLMGKVASDKCHKWVFKEHSADQCEPNISNYWQSSFDALPPEWIDQFACGIQTIAVIQVGHGLLQLGSCKIIAEDLHFVLRMRHMFESLGYQSGFFISQLFSSTDRSNPTATPMKQTLPTRPPPRLFNWNHPQPSPIATFHPMQPPNNNKDDTHLFLLPHPSEPPTGEIIHDPESADIKWPNGLSFFTALTGRSDYSKLMFEGNGGENSCGAVTAEDYLSLESHSSKGLKMDNSSKSKRSFTLPARMSTPPPSSATSSLDVPHHATTPQHMEYRGSENEMYSDYMEILE